MPKLTVDGVELEVPAGATVLQACELAGKEIPRFCYHERLSIAGNCRMCLVEVKPGAPKPQANFALPAADGQEIRPGRPKGKKERGGGEEFLLINNPPECAGSEEHNSKLQTLIRNSFAGLCLENKKRNAQNINKHQK